MKTYRKIGIISAAIILALMGAGCGSTSSDTSSTTAQTVAEVQVQTKRETNYTYLAPEASGEVLYEENDVSIDASNSSQGYVMVKSTGDESAAVWVQIEDPNGLLFTYSAKIGDYETFPFSSGDGAYVVSVLREVETDVYALMLSADIDVKLESEFLPFLYPNQYVNYKAGDSAVELGCKLSDESTDDIDYLSRVYHYIIDNIEYDNELAQNVEVGYVPDNEKTLQTGKGICFDYASLMASLLRSQNIPTKLVVGYAGTEYHAWISVYINELGWLDNVIEFNGKSWSIIDPTMAKSNSEETVRKYTVEEEGYYQAKYYY